MKKTDQKHASASNGVNGHSFTGVNSPKESGNRLESLSAISSQIDAAEELSLLLGNTEESFVVVNTDLAIISFNKEFRKLYHRFFEKDVVKGDCILDYAQPWRRDIVKALYQRVLQGEKLESEIELSIHGQEVRHFTNKFKPCVNENGLITGAFVSIMDVTDKKTSIQLLASSEQRFRALVENSSDGIVILSAEGKALYISPAVEYILGYSEDEALELDMYAMMHPDDLQEAQKTMQEVMANPGKPIEGPASRVKHRDGTWRWLEATITNMLHDPSVGGIIDNFRDVTEKIQAEQELKQSREQLNEERLLLRTLIDNLPINVYTKDLQYRKTLSNRADYIYCGFDSEDDVLGKTDYDLFSELSAIKTQAEDQQVLSTGISILNKEEHHIRKDGREVWFLISKIPLKNKNGRITGLLGISYNITERTEAEEALKKSESQLSVATQLAKLGYWELNIEQGIFTFNEHFYNLLKTSVEEMGGYTMSAEVYGKQFLHPDDGPLVENEIRMAIETTDPFYSRSIEHRIIYPNGEIGHLAVRFFVVKDENGRTIRTVGANQDVTEQKRAAEQIRLAKERYEMVHKTTNEVIYEWDIVNNVNIWGEGYETVFGHTRTGDIMPTDSWLDFLHPDEKEGLLTATLTAFENKLPSLTRELRFRCADGSYKTVFDKLSILYSPEGIPLKIVGAMQDITELKKNELAIRELNERLNNRAEELAASNAELERFAYVASHDLQEPLRMVSSFLQLLQKKYESQLDETAAQYIEYAVGGTDRMKKLILDLLEYSRVGTNQDKRTKTDMTDVAKQVMDIFRTKIDETGATIRVHSLPVINANKSQMTQLIQNLVGNAFKYNTSQTPIIDIGFEDKKDEWQFYIKDNGIGIDPKFYDKVFVIFQRLHNRNQFSGTGIGLAICKKIIDKHDGDIWIDSEVGKGSTFFFTIKK